MDKTVQYFVTNAKTGKVNQKKTKKLREMNKEFDSFMNVEKSAQSYDNSGRMGKSAVAKTGLQGNLIRGANFVRSKFGNRDTQRAYRAAKKAVKG
tara:strand:- start:50 stop:334 length:285 start_codon:yes stop_codon:yes gene_type:complete